MARRFAFRDRVKRALVQLQSWFRMANASRAYRRQKFSTLAVQVGDSGGGGGAQWLLCGVVMPHILWKLEPGRV